jgi:NitT/TauT family transport system substrate-binding protein
MSLAAGRQQRPWTVGRGGVRPAGAAAIDALAAKVDGVDKETYLANLDLILDLVITERSREHGLGWITPERMAGTIELAKAGGNLETELDAEAVFTNAFNSRIPAPK